MPLFLRHFRLLANEAFRVNVYDRQFTQRSVKGILLFFLFQDVRCYEGEKITVFARANIYYTLSRDRALLMHSSKDGLHRLTGESFLVHKAVCSMLEACVK